MINVLITVLFFIFLIYGFAKYGIYKDRKEREEKENQLLRAKAERAEAEGFGFSSLSGNRSYSGVTITRSNDIYQGKYIDGHQCSSSDDLERWYVKKGFSEGYERRLDEIETELKSLNKEGGDELLTEWNDRYEKYRQLCIEHHFWNSYIRDRAPFIPTPGQKEKEEDIRKKITDLYEGWKQRMQENRIILDYLEKCPRKHAVKRELIQALSNDEPARRKEIEKIYKRLKTADVLGEKESDEGKIETRIIVRRNNGEKKPKRLPAAAYQPWLYANITRRDLYKVKYTVGVPQDLDRGTNTCYFKSKTSGTIYSTSLERCTCPVYCKGSVCKHMLALAIQLGFFNQYTVR